MTDDNGAVRVAEDNLRSHIYQLVHKEQTAFEHFLMNEYTAFCLGGNHQQHTEQVWCQSGPGCVGNGHDGAVDKGLYLVRLLCGHVNVVFPLLHLDAESTETVGDNSQVLVGDILDGQFATGHGCHANETAHFNHVGEDGMLGSVQLVYSFDSQEVGGDAFYLSSHPVQHSAKLLHVGFAGGVVDGGLAFGKDGCHYDIGCSRYRCLVE